MKEIEKPKALSKTLNPLLLWGLGVGYVISGMYFGWNLGLEKGGTLGMGIATALIIVLYICFTFSYAELACAIPKAGGVFDYTDRALGKNWSFIAGIAQIIEFTLAPPAIAIGIGSYFNLIFPTFTVIQYAFMAYFIFTLINILGAKLAASFELIVTVLAVCGLLIFTGITLPHFNYNNLTINSLPNGYSGIFAALPFAIWFFLGLEGLANVAEESTNPQKDISKGFGLSLVTLVVLCILIFVSSIGINGWEAIVYKNDNSLSDSPLPLALNSFLSPNDISYNLIVGIGTCGLIASFHGLLLAAGRATFEFAKIGNIPKFFGKVHSKYKSPANALAINMLMGCLAILTNNTGDIIILAVFGALTIYLFAMVSLLLLRKKEPNLKRPYQVFLYPITPIIAITISLITLLTMFYYNFRLGAIYISLVSISFLIFKLKSLLLLKNKKS